MACTVCDNFMGIPLQSWSLIQDNTCDALYGTQTYDVVLIWNYFKLFFAAVKAQARCAAYFNSKIP
jgi:hypothetical protein